VAGIATDGTAANTVKIGKDGKEEFKPFAVLGNRARTPNPNS
jgi:hypothetical protein